MTRSEMMPHYKINILMWLFIVMMWALPISVVILDEYKLCGKEIVE